MTQTDTNTVGAAFETEDLSDLEIEALVVFRMMSPTDRTWAIRQLRAATDAKPDTNVVFNLIHDEAYQQSAVDLGNHDPKRAADVADAAMLVIEDLVDQAFGIAAMVERLPGYRTMLADDYRPFYRVIHDGEIIKIRDLPSQEDAA